MKHDAFILRRLRRGFPSGQLATGRLEATFQTQCIQIRLGHQGSTHVAGARLDQILGISTHACQILPGLLNSRRVAPLSNPALFNVGSSVFGICVTQHYFDIPPTIRIITFITI
jgi:hypothetical protein